MLDLFATLVPADLTPLTTLLLLAVSVLTSFLSAAFGLGGGVALIGVMALFMPASVLIPVHGVIQLGSISGRLAVMWGYVSWPVLLAFGGGGILGAAVGAQLLTDLREGWLELMLGLFIVWACWGPMPRLSRGSPLGTGLAGAVTSTLSLFVGATGALVSALLRGMRLDRMRHVGTFSACMFTQHICKIMVFGVMGFAYGPYIPFMAAMIACGFIGTLIGRMFLVRMNELVFGIILNTILVALGLRLIYVGAGSLFAA